MTAELATYVSQNRRQLSKMCPGTRQVGIRSAGGAARGEEREDCLASEEVEHGGTSSSISCPAGLEDTVDRRFQKKTK